MNKQSVSIGHITLKFFSNGSLKSARYACDVKTEVSLKEIHSREDENVIAEQANIMLSNVFAIVDNAELADREKFVISSVPQNVIRFENGKVKEMTINFTLDEL